MQGMFYRVSLVEPLPNSTKLKVNPEGIAALQQLTGPIAPIVVIGPYRSGKSFLINQMLQQSCGAFLDPSTGCPWSCMVRNHTLTCSLSLYSPLQRTCVPSGRGEAQCLRCLTWSVQHSDAPQMLA